MGGQRSAIFSGQSQTIDSQANNSYISHGFQNRISVPIAGGSGNYMAIGGLDGLADRSASNFFS